MKQQRPIHIKHRDLTKMTDDQLDKEQRYLFNHAERTCFQILQQFRSLELGDLPTWKIIEDLQLNADRHQAICEEIEYRRIMMI